MHITYLLHTRAGVNWESVYTSDKTSLGDGVSSNDANFVRLLSYGNEVQNEGTALVSLAMTNGLFLWTHIAQKVLCGVLPFSKFTQRIFTMHFRIEIISIRQNQWSMQLRFMFLFEHAPESTPFYVMDTRRLWILRSILQWIFGAYKMSCGINLSTLGILGYVFGIKIYHKCSCFGVVNLVGYVPLDEITNYVCRFWVFFGVRWTSNIIEFIYLDLVEHVPKPKNDSTLMFTLTPATHIERRLWF